MKKPISVEVLDAGQDEAVLILNGGLGRCGFLMKSNAARYAAHAINMHDKYADALRELAYREVEYRQIHDRHGDDSPQSGRAWVQLRRAGDQARALLKAEDGLDKEKT